MAKKSKKILIAGDSFAAKWPNTSTSWVDLLSEHFDITNIAQAGIGEYKILKQVKNSILKNFDLIIVSHTSPSRIHVKSHPLHKTGFHKNCDLIYNDLLNRFSFPGSATHTAKKWFDHFYDDDYQIDIYNILREKILSLVDIPYISISHIEAIKNLSIEPIHLDFSAIWPKQRGNINHYNEFGNKLLFDKIQIQIRKMI
jgi:hypothetical protein